MSYFFNTSDDSRHVVVRSGCAETGRLEAAVAFFVLEFGDQVNWPTAYCLSDNRPGVVRLTSRMQILWAAFRKPDLCDRVLRYCLKVMLFHLIVSNPQSTVRVPKMCSSTTSCDGQTSRQNVHFASIALVFIRVNFAIGLCGTYRR